MATQAKGQIVVDLLLGMATLLVLDATPAAAAPLAVFPKIVSLGTGETPTETPTSTATDTATLSPTVTPTDSPSATPSETPTATLTPTPTPTPTMPGISGQILYFVGARPVADVTVNLLGPAMTSVLTDGSGAYVASPLAPGDWQVVPEKDGDVNFAVTGVDAVRVLERVAGLETFTPEQRLACDVTGNGTVSALDATRILQFNADLLARFEVANACQSDWLFLPMPGSGGSAEAPVIGGGMCTPGGIDVPGLSGPTPAQNFTAILFGDCTGNWMP
jgi:hypothetical protein